MSLYRLRDCPARATPHEPAVEVWRMTGTLTAYLRRIHLGLTFLSQIECAVRIETEIKKWGNSLALRVTGIMADMPQFQAGTRVTVDVSCEGLVVKPAVGRLGIFRFPYSESALLAGITPDKAHADVLANPTAFEVDN